MNKVELAKTSVDWGIQIVRIDFNIKDVEKQLKNQFISAYLNGNPTDTVYVSAPATNKQPQQTPVISEIVLERQTTSNLILNPAKIETGDSLKYVPYVALPEETFAKSNNEYPSKITQISN